jgi:hypothetical protein
MAGDYNLNGTVDAADYTVWRNNLGAPPGTNPNDVDLRVIGTAQFVTWKANYGMTLSPLGAADSIAVPEPTGLAILSLGGLLLCLSRRLEITDRVSR